MHTCTRTHIHTRARAREHTQQPTPPTLPLVNPTRPGAVSDTVPNSVATARGGISISALCSSRNAAKCSKQCTLSIPNICAIVISAITTERISDRHTSFFSFYSLAAELLPCDSSGCGQLFKLLVSTYNLSNKHTPCTVSSVFPHDFSRRAPPPSRACN